MHKWLNELEHYLVLFLGLNYYRAIFNSFQNESEGRSWLITSFYQTSKTNADYNLYK